MTGPGFSNQPEGGTLLEGGDGRSSVVRSSTNATPCGHFRFLWRKRERDSRQTRLLWLFPRGGCPRPERAFPQTARAGE
jgi:hypothetical protein